MQVSVSNYKELSMNKYVAAGLGILGLSVVAVFLFNSANSIQVKTDIGESNIENKFVPVIVTKSKPLKQPLDKKTIEFSIDESINEAPIRLKSYDDWCFANELTQSASTRADDEYYKWSAERNHNVGDRKQLLEAYKQYGLKPLKILGEQGDLVALAAIALNSDNSIELQDWAARTAAIYGGTGDALQHIPSTRKAKAASLLFRGLNEEAKKTFLEGMAWDEFMVLRGDTTLLETTPFLLSQDAYKDIEITKSDEEWVSNRAKEIYAEISEERLGLGLGEFDNSVPKSVEIENLASAAFAKNEYGAENHHMKYFPENECLSKRISLTSKN